MNSDRRQRTFQGVGWRFAVNEIGGSIATRSFEEQIEQSILLIIGTAKGERRMRPDFGAGLNRFVFEPMSVATLEGIRRTVEEALIDWEPRIDVQRVAVTPDPIEQGKVVIDTEYRVRATNARRNLVYPFYLEEGPTR